ncbi:MAG TPA: serine/threonine-protein kinase [Chloroflexota bacterium]|nr:serine/threonine-protein kinase [Chloroflexota bacterium]
MIIRTRGRVYRVYREIGRGRLTRVYLARPHGATRPVAVKMLDERAAGDPGVAEQFQRDAHLASQLRDERVVGVLGVGERAGTPFVVMEYVEGTTLAALVRDHGPLPLPDAVAIVDQVLRAVEAVASAGIAHRDLGSHNLVLTRSGTVKLLDFGIPASGALAGAPSDARSDLPVLRALLRELLTGETTSDGPSPARETRPDVLAEVDAMLERVVTTSPDEMRAALRQLRSGHGQAARASSDAPLSAAERTPLWRRGRVRGLAAGLALLALVGAAALFVAVTSPTPAVGAVDPPAAAGPTRTPMPEPTATPLLGPIEALRRLSGAAPPTSAPPPTDRPQPAPPPAGYPAPGTRTPRATSTPPPEETADELWSAALTRVDAAWSKGEWPQVIAELDGFRARVPDHPGADEKLYGALVSYGVALQQQGRSALAARYLSRAQTLLPERGEAGTAMLALSATPTLEPTSTPASPVAAASAPRRASAARAAPPPTPVVEQVDEPAPPSPAADPPTPTPTATPLPPSPTPVPPTPTPTTRPTRTPTPANLPPTLTPTPTRAPATPTPTRAPATPTPTPTATPTATPVPPTATPVPPTATRPPPTATPPRTPTPTTTPSPAPPTATPRTTVAQPTAPPTTQPPTATPTQTPTPASVSGTTAPSPTRAP